MTGKPMAQHVRQHLLDTGAITLEPIPATRHTRATNCRDCSQPILRGLDADICAIATNVDPTPLNPLGEAIARATGRRTYTLRWMGNHYQLGPRDPETIRAHPAGDQANRYDVLAIHECGSPALPTAPSALPVRATVDTTAEPPY